MMEASVRKSKLVCLLLVVLGVIAPLLIRNDYIRHVLVLTLIFASILGRG